ncbi:hypothetical protein GCU60_05685 [Blastococcus saxobsidens]|uniref:Uncharacterized protein n=1 Tax=Blastococcus saxobsidens TaxID=138336 RepID=A0A6L9VZL9_9ACTN|nr:hypothetical protein [Blastococcus saxobsidens]NEK85255.1 hypothetical protein [Blastococcus saxobsidens]
MSDNLESWSVGTPQRLFGVPTLLTSTDASAIVAGLSTLRDAQSSTLPPTARRVPADLSPLAAELARQRYWFDPVAKGERVREALAALPRVQVRIPHSSNETVIVVPDPPGQRVEEPGARMLLTPEGTVVLHCVERAVQAARQAEALPGEPIQLDPGDTQAALLTLADAYRSWTRQRVNQVIALLTTEPSTLRPAAAGLLLVLLLNRNTSRDRALPRPKDRRRLETISGAIAGPALAYARTLTGSERATATGVDLYRGWALGELTRRLGGGLHTGLDEGIYLDPAAENDALARLADDVSRRPAAARARVEAAIDAALEAYTAARPVLAGLALAYDRPSNTQRIRDALLDAARGRKPEKEE